MKKLIFIILIFASFVSFAQVKDYEVQAVSILQADDFFVWQNDTIRKDSIVYAENAIDSIRFHYINGNKTKWYLNSENIKSVFVPYIGAYKNVDLDTLGLKAGYIDFAEKDHPIHSGYRLFADTSSHTLAFYNDEQDITLQIGQEMWVRIKNQTGLDQLNGTIVRITGSTGGTPLVEIASNDIHTLSEGVLGMVTHDIETNTFGFVTTVGQVRDVNTSMCSEGDLIYLGLNGAFTNVRPVATNFVIEIGTCLLSDAVNGIILVHMKGSPHDIVQNAFNGHFLESEKFITSSNGTTITGTLERSGGGDLTMQLSSGFFTLDCTPALTIALTPGSTTVPQTNYVYILASTKALTVSTSDWPSDEHIKVAEVALLSATQTLTDGAIRNQNWNDHLTGSNGVGHVQHINERIRRLNADWKSGVELSASVISAVDPDNVYVSTTAGKIYQMHLNDFDAQSLPTDDIHIANSFTLPYVTVSNLNGLLTDALGATLANRSFSFVIWGVQNETGEKSHLMLNLPIGSYSSSALAILDASNYSVYTLPDKFRGVGFLIARVTFSHSPSGSGTWTLNQVQDLRGYTPNLTAGGGASGSGGITTYLGLTDTPNSYTANKLHGTNSAGTAMEEKGATATLAGSINIPTGQTYQVNSVQIASSNLKDVKNINIARFDTIDYVALGNSITYGVGSTSGTTSYSDILNSRFGFKTFTKLAVPGATAMPTTSRPDILTQITAIPSGSDLITIMVGVNDYGSGNIVGNVNHVKRRLYASLNRSASFLEAFRYDIETIQLNHPNSKLIVIIPLRTTASGTYLLEDYIRGEIEICNFLNIPIIDLYYSSNIIPTVSLFPDGLHPNDSGYQKIADYVGSKLFSNGDGININTPKSVVYFDQGITSKTYTASYPLNEGMNLSSYSTNDPSYSYGRYSDIVGLGAQDGSLGGGIIRMLTNPVTSATATEHLRITQDGKFGFGTTLPPKKYTFVYSGTASNNDIGFIVRDNQSISNGGVGGKIKFGSKYTTSGTTNDDLGFIGVAKQNTIDGDYGFSLVFGSRANALLPSEKGRFTGRGAFLVGTTSDNLVDIGQFNGSILATTAKLTNLTDGYIPYHYSDALGFVNSTLFTDGTNLTIKSITPKLIFGNIINPAYIKGNWIDNDNSSLEFHVFDATADKTALTLEKTGNVDINYSLNVDGGYSRGGVGLFLDKFRTGFMGTSGQIPVSNGISSDFTWISRSSINLSSFNNDLGNYGGFLTSYTETDPIVKTINGIVKSNGAIISAAISGTDYEVPLIFSTGLNRTGNTIVNTLPDQVVSLTQGGLTTISGTYPNFTISSSGDGTGQWSDDTYGISYSGKVGIGTTSHSTAILNVSGTSLFNNNPIQGVSAYELVGGAGIGSFTAGYGNIYYKNSDNKLYFRNGLGTEYDLTATGAGMTWPSSAGIAVYSGSSSWGTSITDSSSDWNTAYADRMKWDGGSTGLVAATGRTSLGLGTAALNNTGDFVPISFSKQVAIYGTAYYGELSNTSFNWSGSYIELSKSFTPTSGSTLPITSDAVYTALSLKQDVLSGTGFVKSTGGSISYDNSSYSLTTHTHNYAALNGSYSNYFQLERLRFGSSTAWNMYGSGTSLEFNYNNAGVSYLTSGGDFYSNNFIATSDRRLKTGITSINFDTGVDNIRFVSFTMKNDTTNRLRYGVIAQEVEEFMPEVVHTDANGQKSVAYIDLIIAKLASLEKRLSELEHENKCLKAKKSRKLRKENPYIKEFEEYFK